MFPRCPTCNIPIDAQPFDVSGYAAAPKPGQRIILATFTLPAQYCGVLEYFSQFTDTYAMSPTQIATPTLHWTVQSNERPLHPYVDVTLILNPWGFGSFPTSIRIEEQARVELVVSGVEPGDTGTSKDIKQFPAPSRIAGRIAGKYWYNEAYGGTGRAR